MTIQTKNYKCYYSVENYAGTDLKLMPEEKYNENKHGSIEQEYSIEVSNGQLLRAERELQELFKQDRAEWLDNSFGYLN